MIKYFDWHVSSRRRHSTKYSEKLRLTLTSHISRIHFRSIRDQNWTALLEIQFLMTFFKYNSSFCHGLYFWSEITSHHSMKSATLQLNKFQQNKFQQAQNRHILTIEHHYNTLLRDWGWKRQMSSRGIQTCNLAIRDRRFWPRFFGILGALV